MNLKHLAETAGLLVPSDSIHVQSMRLRSGVPARIRRFGKLIHEVVLAPHATAHVAAARLVALDGVRPDSLRLLDSAFSSLFVWQSHVHVEWKEEAPPRLERRALSASTLSALEARASSAPGSDFRGSSRRSTTAGDFTPGQPLRNQRRCAATPSLRALSGFVFELTKLGGRFLPAVAVPCPPGPHSARAQRKPP
jgi:hypothetical protein